ncbi:MAG TPA: serine/threonine-protein kinase [Kofleriaceae bacterium]|nr:serine/threonine-protein kinase [Kofleriaceae bacterium]
MLDHLASGGMGQVYLARATGLGGFERRVVVKTLDPSTTEDDEAFIAMFLDEARLLGQLHHQYISPIYEVGCDDEGRYYLVMDYVHGETAETVWKRANDRDKQLPFAFALTVVIAVANALDYAHNLRDGEGRPLDIVHRDVSLSNVMIGYDGAVKLIDFGIAKAANRATKTGVGMLKGKLAYLAPEQVVHKAVDHRADIFALGIVLYELTTMTRAFRADSDLLTLERITTGTVPLPSLVVRGYPNALEEIVMRCLQVDPAARYQHAGDLAVALEKLAAASGMLLGHGAITSPMKQLFSERRRRFAHSSSRIKQLDAPVDASELTPVTPLDELTPLTPVEPVRALEPADSATMTTVNPVVPLAVEHDETTEPVEMPLIAPPPPEVRFRAPSPPSLAHGSGQHPLTITQPTNEAGERPVQLSPFSGTAVVRRRAPRRIEPYYYIGVAVFVLAVLAAILR